MRPAPRCYVTRTRAMQPRSRDWIRMAARSCGTNLHPADSKSFLRQRGLPEEHLRVTNWSTGVLTWSERKPLRRRQRHAVFVIEHEWRLVVTRAQAPHMWWQGLQKITQFVELVTKDGEQCAKRAFALPLCVCLGQRARAPNSPHEGAGCPQELDHVETECASNSPAQTGVVEHLPH